MKTTKAIPHLLIASALLFSAACSSTNTGASSGTTSGTATGTGASTGATGADNTGFGTGGAAGVGTAQGSTSAASTAGTAGSGSSGAGAAGTDMAAFMGSIATMQDPTFLLTAASSNLLEVQAGQMAAQKASSASVKKFAQMMVQHHTQATKELQAVTTPLGVTPSQTLMPIHQAIVDGLTKKSAGKDFDEGYMDAMETAHNMDIAMFEAKSKAAETPAVKAFATKTLPMLQSHRKMAGELEKKVD
jgi:putative membrane protein